MSARGRMLIIALPVIVLLAGGAAFLALRGGRSHKAPNQPEATAQLALADLVVNLADPDRSRYLTVSVTLVITGAPGEGGKPEDVLLEKDAQIRDAVLMVMSRHKYRDLLPAEGKEALKGELATAVSGALEEEGLRVTEVLFTAFVME